MRRPSPTLPATLDAQLADLGLTAGRGHGFVPPPEVAEAAALGLALRRMHGRGGTAVGLARAEGLSRGRPVPPREMRVIAAWFARFAYLRCGPNWADPERPSAGYIAWMLWGGDAGRAWVERHRDDWS